MLTGVQERWIETLIVSIFLVLNIAFSQESILYHVPPENVSSGESVKIIISLFSDARVLESKLLKVWKRTFNSKTSLKQV